MLPHLSSLPSARGARGRTDDVGSYERRRGARRHRCRGLTVVGVYKHPCGRVFNFTYRPHNTQALSSASATHTSIFITITHISMSTQVEQGSGVPLSQRAGDWFPSYPPVSFAPFPTQAPDPADTKILVWRHARRDGRREAWTAVDVKNVCKMAGCVPTIITWPVARERNSSDSGRSLGCLVTIPCPLTARVN